MQTAKALIFSLLTLLSINAFSHGEDKPGPHGGFIRMPGPFHTELVIDGKNNAKIYLLDMGWENPSVKNSSLKIKLNKKTEANCVISDDHYVCTFAGSIDLSKKGELKVTAEREQQKGIEVSYKLPLKFEKPKNQHGGHH